MKKTLLVLMVILWAVIAAQAQSLTGKTWVHNMDNNVTAQMVFNEDGTMTMTLDGDIEDDVHLNLAIPCTYKKHTKRLCFKLDLKNSDINLSSSASDGSISEDYLKQLKDGFKQKTKKDKTFSKKQMFRIKKLTESQLELVDAKGVSTVFYAQ